MRPPDKKVEEILLGALTDWKKVIAVYLKLNKRTHSLPFALFLSCISIKWCGLFQLIRPSGALFMTVRPKHRAWKQQLHVYFTHLQWATCERAIHDADMLRLPRAICRELLVSTSNHMTSLKLWRHDLHFIR